MPAIKDSKDSELLAKLYKASFNELLLPDYQQIIEKLPEAWERLAQYHFHLTPLPHQNPQDFFWHSIYLNTQTYTFKDAKFKAALEFGHYQAIQISCKNYLNFKKFDKAINLAIQATETYLAAGYCLLADTYLASAQQITEESSKKQYYRDAMIAIRLAIALKNQSAISLSNAKIKIDNTWLSTRASKIKIAFTSNELTLIQEDVKEVLKKYKDRNEILPTMTISAGHPPAMSLP